MLPTLSNLGTTYQYDFKHADYAGLNNFLVSFDWHGWLTNSDVEEFCVIGLLQFLI